MSEKTKRSRRAHRPRTRGRARLSPHHTQKNTLSQQVLDVVRLFDPQHMYIWLLRTGIWFYVFIIR